MLKGSAGRGVIPNFMQNSIQFPYAVSYFLFVLCVLLAPISSGILSMSRCSSLSSLSLVIGSDFPEEYKKKEAKIGCSLLLCPGTPCSLGLMEKK